MHTGRRVHPLFHGHTATRSMSWENRTRFTGHVKDRLHLCPRPTIRRVLSKRYPEPLQFAKIWSNLFFQRKTATRNNSVFPGLRKNTTGASKLHFLEKYASCLKLPKLHRAAAMMDDQIQWSVQRGRSPNHTGTDRKPALALAPPHSRRLGVLDPWQPNFIIFLWNKSYLPKGCVGETPPKALPCLAVLTGPAPAPRSHCVKPIGDHSEPPDHKSNWLALTLMLSTVSLRYAVCESQAVMLVERKTNIWSSPNNESRSWKKRNPYSWQLLRMKFWNCLNININSMKSWQEENE